MIFKKQIVSQKMWCTLSAVLKSNVSIWSPLAEAFNTRPMQKFNFRRQDVGLFGVNELKACEGFQSLRDQCISKTDSLINEALNASRHRKMVEIFDDMSDSLCQVADLAEFIRLAHPEAKYSRAAEEACCAVSGIVEKLNTNVDLYNALKHSVLCGDIKATTTIDKHVGKLFLFDFEQCGIHLSEWERNRIVSLNDAILNLGHQFVSGTASPRMVKKSLLPNNVRDVFVSDNDEIIVSGLYTDSLNPTAREMAYRIFLYPDTNQDLILNELLTARHELAEICGFSSYADRALRGATVDDPTKVKTFLYKLSQGIWYKAKLDFECMENMKKVENYLFTPLGSWDVPYFTQKAKKDWFRVSSKEYSPYFSLGGEVWNSDVYKLSVIHETEGLLGYIYCDFYERTGKSNQDCHFTIRGGRRLADGSYQLPIVVLMLNLPTPRWSSPSLLSPNMVDNLFHEMGHAMHSMLARTQYQHVTGTRCSTDFAEVPSVLMEYFSSDHRVLKKFAKHFQTKQPISEDMLRRLCASKRLFTASETQLQIFYAAIDQAYHGKHPLKGSTTEVLAETQKSYYGLPYITNTAWQLRFSHLVGYGAKYYSYLVSRALAYSIWQTYFENDPFSREKGEKYRHECLAYGGGKHPKDLITDFLQVEPTPDILARSLLNEIDYHQSQVDLVLGKKI
ncbi:mitochondrial intermediate peptidase isoform X2 [Anoplophora glabripennis]|uniref:mitochondrial intermediate peptidase isoform X2 n=1 Tax=Anoplophora glabripennis TaxID=217634 RepID=UPI0008742F5D|nr:mitochondrial intermediate peptidase isoform X2 [Anoplophora glabripennis]